MENEHREPGMAVTVGRLEGKVEGLATRLTGIEQSIDRQSSAFSSWKDEVIRLQERTRIRATVATVLAVAIPAGLVLALKFLGMLVPG